MVDWMMGDKAGSAMLSRRLVSKLAMESARNINTCVVFYEMNMHTVLYCIVPVELSGTSSRVCSPAVYLKLGSSEPCGFQLSCRSVVRKGYIHGVSP